MAALTWPNHDPDETIDYDVDWSAMLAGDTIESSTFEEVGELDALSGITLEDSSNTENSTKVWISGGTEGSTAVVTNTVVTAAGRVMQQSMLLPIASN